MTSGIYSIINTIINSIYVGSAVDLDKRFREHKHGNKSNLRLQRAIKKHGIDSFSFEILQIVEDTSKLLYEEQFWLDTVFMFYPNVYNLAPIAGNTLGVRWSNESKKKFSEKITGRKHSEETKIKLSNMNKGKKKPERNTEYRYNIGRSHAKSYKLCSPDGTIVEIFNMSEFCRIHGYSDSAMCQVANGKRKQYKGWTIAIIGDKL